MSKDVRQLPAVEKRVETGAVRFGDDWPGLFIRGDDAMYLAMCIDFTELLLDGVTMLPSQAVYFRRLVALRDKIRKDVLL